MVPEAIEHFSWAVLIYALLSLTLIRMVPVAISLVGSGLRLPSLTFLGWFGPRGLASILFVLVVVEEGRLASGPLLEGTVVLTVLLSAMMHGATAYPFARRYGAYVERNVTTREDHEVVEMPVRVSHTESN